jgi:hypothetical protein
MTMTVRPVRQPLGLPAGSVRGILALLIVIQFWILLLLPDSMAVRVPANLYLLLSFVALFFVSHGRSIAAAVDPEPSPLHLPGGTLRIIIFGGTALVVGYVIANMPDRLNTRLRLSDSQMDHWPIIIGAYVGGFTLGYFFRVMPFRHHWVFQSFLAWIAIIAMALLLIEIVIQAFIRPTLREQFDLPTWEAVVTGVTSVYFGTRS